MTGNALYDTWKNTIPDGLVPLWEDLDCITKGRWENMEDQVMGDRNELERLAVAENEHAQIAAQNATLRAEVIELRAERQTPARRLDALIDELHTEVSRLKEHEERTQLAEAG